MIDKPSTNDIKALDKLIIELQNDGVTLDTEKTGLGDVLEEKLKKLGITEEKFQRFFGLKECGCKKRKKWLNKILSTKKIK